MSHPLVDMKKRILSFWDIAQLQDMLNYKADKKNPDWRAARNVADFQVAAMLELSEQTESMPWKWWKGGGDIDEWNIKIEAIDMLHFLTSICLLNGIPQEACGVTFCNLDQYDDEHEQDKVFNQDVTKADRNVIAQIGALIFHPDLSVCGIDYMLKASGLTDMEVSATYVAKLTLNEFRWENGYDLGLYKKLTSLVDDSGKRVVEDNEFLFAIVQDFINNEEMLLEEIPGLVRGIMEKVLEENHIALD